MDRVPDHSVKSVNRLQTGLGIIASGRGYLKENPKLKKWYWIPLLINVTVFIGGLYFLGGQVGGWVESSLAWLDVVKTWDYFAWLYPLIFYPLKWIAWVAFLFFWIYLTFAIGTLISAPFNSLLAEKVLENEGIPVGQKGLKDTVVFMLSMLKVSLVKAAVFSGLGIILFVLSFIPGLNIVASFLALMFIAYDCFDYALEARGLGFRERMGYFKKRSFTIVGLAFMLSITLLIPGSLLLLTPWAVVGAAKNSLL